MEKKYDEFIGVDKVHVAVITEDSAANYTAETPAPLAPVAEITGEPEIENKTTYYDNVPANNYVSEGATPLKMVFSGIDAELAAKLLGKKFDTTTGRLYDSGKPNPPYVAVSFRFNKGANNYRYYQYLKGTFSGGAEEAATKKAGGVEEKTYSMTFTAITTTHEFTVDTEDMVLKRIFADTTDENFDASEWFDNVQTPSTIPAP